MMADNTYLFIPSTKRRDIPRFDLSLEMSWIHGHFELVYSLNDKRDFDFKLSKANTNKLVSIYDCFKIFTKLEKLEMMNEWYCKECKKHQNATKKMEIYRSPHILIIQLKRFTHNMKIEKLVDFPISDLDVSDFVIDKEDCLPLKYELFAVSNHFGNLQNGHYNAYSKNPVTKKWYKYDDANIEEIAINDVVSKHAYVLFYRRKHLENIIQLEELYSSKFKDYENRMTKGLTSFVSVSNTALNSPDKVIKIDKRDHSEKPNLEENILSYSHRSKASNNKK